MVACRRKTDLKAYKTSKDLHISVHLHSLIKVFTACLLRNGTLGNVYSKQRRLMRWCRCTGWFGSFLLMWAWSGSPTSMILKYSWHEMLICQKKFVSLRQRPLEAYTAGDFILLMLSSLGKTFSRQHFEILYFFQKTGFHISCKLSPMETVCMKCQNLWGLRVIAYLLEKSNPRKQDFTFHANCLQRRQFAWNVKICEVEVSVLIFWKKIRKIFQNVVCWKFYPEC